MRVETGWMEEFGDGSVLAGGGKLGGNREVVETTDSIKNGRCIRQELM